MSPAKPTPPAILLHADRRTPEGALTTLLLGIEEEGVPVEVHRRDEANPLVLAHDAAGNALVGACVVSAEQKLSARRHRDPQVGLRAAAVTTIRGGQCVHHRSAHGPFLSRLGQVTR